MHRPPPVAASASTSPAPLRPLPQLGWNILGYLLLRFTKPRYLPLTAAAAAPPAPAPAALPAAPLPLLPEAAEGGKGAVKAGGPAAAAAVNGEHGASA